MLTSKEFAKLIGVSQPLVSRALNNSTMIAPGKKEYILRKAKEYGFVLNTQARSLRTNRTGTIGILFPKHFKSMNANPMLAHMYDQVQFELSQLGYDIVVVYDYGTKENNISAFERIIKKRKVDGFIILRLELSKDEIKLIHEGNVPCIHLLNSYGFDSETSSCVSDSENGGYQAGKFFGTFKDYEKYFFNVADETTDALKRLSGYKRGLVEAGYDFKCDNIIKTQISYNSAYNTIMQQIDRFRNEKIALLAYNDVVGIGAVQAFRDSGFNIPNDVQIIGMDDIPLASQIVPKLSTIKVPVEKMAKIGCTWLFNAIENKDLSVSNVVLEPTICLRDTTL